MKFGKRLMMILVVLAMALAGLACDGSVPAKEPEKGPSQEQTQITDATLLSAVQSSSDLKAKLLSELRKDASLTDLTPEEMETAMSAVMQEKENATVAGLKAHIAE